MKKFEQLFPLVGHVTQEMIDFSDVNHPMCCRGALAFKEALGSNIELVVHPPAWGTTYGSNNVWKDDKRKADLLYHITTKEGYDFTKLSEPTEVTFIIALKNKEPYKNATLNIRKRGPNSRGAHRKTSKL